MVSLPLEAVPPVDERIAALEAALVAATAERDKLAEEREKLAEERDKLASERAQLRAAYERVLEELELLRRRLFVAKAERVDTKQIELEFMLKKGELDQLAGAIPGEADRKEDEGSDGDGTKRRKSSKKPSGRRSAESLDHLPETRVVVPCDLPDGATIIGEETSTKLGWQRGGPIKLVIVRTKYKVETDAGPLLETTPKPPELLERSLAAPSLLAHIAVDKFADGLPLYRQEERFERLGLTLDRGTMSRWLEDLGATCGATVVESMRKDALEHAFCIATDASGLAVQPIPTAEKKRQACRKGHIFVFVADKDHVFFEYTPKETSRAVSRMFHGFSGYVQADAKSVFDVLFTPPDERPPPDDGEVKDLGERREVGCWSHARRNFWESAIAKNAVAREALFRIARFFDKDASWRGEAPATIKARRDQHLRPEMEAFFAWATAEYDKVKDQRGSLRSAFGYALRQKDALMRVCDDGRLHLDNNRSERALRTLAVGRKNWLFVGSDDHANSAANLLSLIASARLHKLDPESYLRDLIRVLPHWPKDRYLELAPKHWAHTRSRLDGAQLDAELGPLHVPEPPQQQPSPD